MRPLKTLYDRSTDVWTGFNTNVEQVEDSVVRWRNAQNINQCVYFRVSMSGVVQVQMGEGSNLFAEVQEQLGWEREAWAPVTVTSQGKDWKISGPDASVRLSSDTAVVTTGSRVFTLTQLGNKALGIQCRVSLDSSEQLFGFGEKVGGLNKRGRMWTQWATDVTPHTPDTDPLYQAIPFSLIGSESGWRGIFAATSTRTYFDATQEDGLWIAADVGPLVLELMGGNSPAEVITQYTAITGRMPLPPLLALGFHQSRYSYMRADDVLDVAQKFRAYDIPLDAIHLDIDYMDGYRVFTFNPETFENPDLLSQATKERGVSLISIVDPGVKVDDAYRVYREGHAREYFIRYANGNEFHSHVWPGLCAFPDFLRKDVRAWWGEWNQRWLQQGITGIWNDMNEPALWGIDPEKRQGDAAEENGILHYADDGKWWPHQAVHNLYALLEAEATFQGMSTVQPRPFILTRSGFSGIQRYAAVWTGDNSSTWEHLAMAIPMCLNLGLSGVPWVGTDIGGFLGICSPELYTRWLQLGSFLPFSRAHTDRNTPPNEPWAYGLTALNVARDYIRYRYRLLAYWYALAREARDTGVPLMRPIWWQDKRSLAVECEDEFLLGDSLLVAPVVKEGVTEREVYFPNGLWWNVWEHTWHSGHGRAVIKAPLDRLPLFLRSGAIIPLTPVVSSTAEWSTSPWPETMLVIRGMGAFTLYADDGHSTLYKDGEYWDIGVNVEDLDSRLQVGWTLRHRPSQQSLLSLPPVTFRVGPLSDEPYGVILEQRRGQQELEWRMSEQFCEFTVDLLEGSGMVEIRMTP